MATKQPEPEVRCSVCRHAAGWHQKRAVATKEGGSLIAAAGKPGAVGSRCQFPGCGCTGLAPHYPTFDEMRRNARR